jgi:hypothetical protein
LDDTEHICKVLRLLVGIGSNFTLAWLVCMSGYYYMLTMKPRKCSSPKALLVWCTFGWGVSVLLPVVAFAISGEAKADEKSSCWNGKLGQIMEIMLLTNSLFLLLAVSAFQLGTFCRIRCRWDKIEQLSSECPELLSIGYKLKVCFVAFLLFAITYIIIGVRFFIISAEHDVLDVVLCATRGVVVAVSFCVLDEDVTAVVSSILSRSSTEQTQCAAHIALTDIMEAPQEHAPSVADESEERLVSETVD